MKRSILDLIALQNADLRIRELEKKYKSIPAERQELVAEFDIVRKALAAAENQVRQTELRIKGIEGEIEAKKKHLSEIRLRSGSVKNVASYNALMADSAATEKAVSELEDSLLLAMEQLEKDKVSAEKAGRSYRATGRTVQKEVLALDQMKEDILAEVQAKAAESKELEKKVALSTLTAYKRMLSSGKGTPVGQVLEGGLCSNCSLKLPPMTLGSARKGDLAVCDNCSCFLYDPEAAD